MTVKPKSESQKYSGLLNCMANAAKGGEKKYSDTRSRHMTAVKLTAGLTNSRRTD